MNDFDFFIKGVTVDLIYSSLGSINENFISISFDVYNNQILIKFLLKEITEIEDELIYDIIAEYSALQDNCAEVKIKTVTIEIGKYIVFHVK